jgi:TfoX/Sxy family transcriptional regulator of competence genes
MPSREMPKFTKAPPDLVARFNDAIRPLMSEIEPRKMFGYPSAFIGGQMFTGLFQDRMHLRLSDADRAEFLKIDGAILFEPMPGRAMKEYVMVPPSILNSDEKLGAWLKKSAAYARSLPPKVKKPKKK